MALGVGSRIGPYEITAPLGTGGMGVVFRARDTRLQRDVALKLLPEHLALDPDRLNRFEREAQLLASLNHPHIAHVYGLESVAPSEAGPSTGQAIAMELVDGETLAERIDAHGPLPADEAIRIALQIVAALEAAHERGIVHRDLKPSNISLTRDGTVKVLDFGLAKEVGTAGSTTALSNSPTVTGESMPGVIMGTLPYMSPEQARGKTVDARADIWAFGCVVYEMLTGKRAFDDETATDIIAKVVSGEPKWDGLPKTTPASLRQLLRVTLTKDVRERLQHIGDSRLFLNARDEPASTSPARHAGRYTWIPLAIGAVVLLAALVPAALYLRREPATAPAMRFEIAAPGFNPAGNPIGSIAISPNGQQIAYVAAIDGRPRIMLRSVDSAATRVIDGTENASGLFWSPDSRYLAFIVPGMLKKLEVASGTAQNIVETVVPVPGAWNAADVILLAAGPGTMELSRVTASGSKLANIHLDAGKGAAAASLAKYLPGGRHVLYHVLTPVSGGVSVSVYVGPIEGGTGKHILDLGQTDLAAGGTLATFVEPGFLMYTKSGTLLAQRFDIDRLEPVGPASPIAENVRSFAASDTGVVVYSNNAPTSATGPFGPAFTQRRQLTYFTRAGAFERRLGEPAVYLNPKISPDGTRIAVQKLESSSSDIWLLDAATGLTSRLTFDPATEGVPVWSARGDRILFASSRRSPVPFPNSLYARAASGSGDDQLLLEARLGELFAPNDWSDDGSVVFARTTLARIQDAADLWVLPTGGDRAPYLLVHPHKGRAGAARFSPDGRWLAYTTDETGSNQIVVRPFPDVAKGMWQIPGAAGGQAPVWRRDSQELFYLAPDGMLMAVPVKLSETPQFGQPIALFKPNLPAQTNPPQYMFDVSPDGKHVLLNLLADEAPREQPPAPPAPREQLTVVVNWTSLLSR